MNQCVLEVEFTARSRSIIPHDMADDSKIRSDLISNLISSQHIRKTAISLLVNDSRDTLNVLVCVVLQLFLSL